MHLIPDPTSLPDDDLPHDGPSPVPPADTIEASRPARRPSMAARGILLAIPVAAILWVLIYVLLR